MFCDQGQTWRESGCLLARVSVGFSGSGRSAGPSSQATLSVPKDGLGQESCVHAVLLVNPGDSAGREMRTERC